MAAQQQKENYQRVLDQTIEQLTKEGKVPTLLLHSCCAPCSSYVLEKLSEDFEITVFYYNPNIYLVKRVLFLTQHIWIKIADRLLAVG